MGAAIIRAGSAAKRRWLAAAHYLFPGYFALVMATGVIAIAAKLLHFAYIPQLLLGVNWVAYPLLWLLTLTRAIAFRGDLLRDMADHQRAPGFFTIVAGSAVFGTQNLLVAGWHGVASALWWFALCLWLIIMYGFFTAVTVRERKPTLAGGINGAWLIAAVATQSLVVLRAALGVGGGEGADVLMFLALVFFLIGAMLYLAIIPLIFYRLTFVRMSAGDFGPPYWINMGAVAIATLAGVSLIDRAGDWPLLGPCLPFIHGFTLFFWAIATWWIPFLFALMLWRYGWKRDPLRYEPAFWGMVFPLGMYTTATYRLAHSFGFDFLLLLPRTIIFVALAAWLVTMTGLIHQMVRSART